MSCLIYTVARTTPADRRMFGPLYYLRGCSRYAPTSHVVFRCAVPITLAQG